MRVIHILRKPLSEGTVASNVLKHGCGGLNIDASRIAGEPWTWGTQTDIRGGGYGSKRPSGGDVFATNVQSDPKGRWPANLILQHLDGCRCAGTKKVKPSNGSRTAHTDNATQPSFVKGGLGAAGMSGTFGFVDDDGKETVANWICVEGCPVAALDEQSGDVPSSGLRPKPYQGSPGIYGGNIGKKQGPLYADKGGVSRFFKQVGGKIDEAD